MLRYEACLPTPSGQDLHFGEDGLIEFDGFTESDVDDLAWEDHDDLLSGQDDFKCSFRDTEEASISLRNTFGFAL